MHGEPRVASLMRVEERDDLVRAFEARLVESSTLAFRVAYGVLRHREDAEDVAQEAFAKAYRSFRQLRDRDRFRAWLVRMTWRMAIDRMRTNRRRGAHEITVDPGDNDPEPQSGRTPAQTAEAEDRSAHLCTAGEAAMADENRTMNDQSIDRALREALDVSAARRWRAIRRRVRDDGTAAWRRAREDGHVSGTDASRAAGRRVSARAPPVRRGLALRIRAPVGHRQRFFVQPQAEFRESRPQNWRSPRADPAPVGRWSRLRLTVLAPAIEIVEHAPDIVDTFDQLLLHGTAVLGAADALFDLRDHLLRKVVQGRDRVVRERAGRVVRNRSEHLHELLERFLEWMAVRRGENRLGKLDGLRDGVWLHAAIVSAAGNIPPGLVVSGSEGGR